MSQKESKPSIKSKIDQLDEAVEWFYGEDFTIDEALARYQAACKLAKSIESDLSKLKNEVEVLADFTKE